LALESELRGWTGAALPERDRLPARADGGVGPAADETRLTGRDLAAGRLRPSAGSCPASGRADAAAPLRVFRPRLTVVYFLALLPFLPALANPANLSNTLSNVWPLFAVAIGQTFVLAIGGIDLSQGAVVG
jgi:hypothetical protein